MAEEGEENQGPEEFIEPGTTGRFLVTLLGFPTEESAHNRVVQ